MDATPDIASRLTHARQGSRFLTIAGPCSAESEAQVLETARALAYTRQVACFRMGIWKPRTRPGGFQGLGDAALPWIDLVKKETGLQVCTEVASPKQVESVLKAGIDMVWIGARTTVNPFLVQDLADALKGVNIPVLVKNPVSQDLGLWLGAVERFEKAGVAAVGAVHRGFSQFEEGLFRNQPQWHIAIELKNRRPDLPLICDPSHITGNAELVPYVAQTALDLGYDGLMIEVHPNPQKALSDAAQQITPERLMLLLHELILRKNDFEEPVVMARLEALRQEIDKEDQMIVAALARRFDLVNQIGHLKKEEGIKVLQMNRWRKVLSDRLEQAGQENLSPSLIRKLYELIHMESISLQDTIVNQSGKEATA